MMRVLLTGSGGFLGQHILASPAAAGMHFVRASRTSRGLSEQHEVILGPGPWGKAEFEHALNVSQADVVLHCAGATHGDAKQLFEANTLPAAGLIAAISQMPNPPRVILIGSAAEYGHVSADALPVREDHPCHPRSEYGISKYAQTLQGLAAAERGLPVLTVRLFNPVGLGMPRGLALPSFARRIAEASKGDRTIKVGDLEARRDFIDVVEAARLLIQLAGCSSWPWTVVNLCSGQAVKLRSLLDGLIAASGQRFQVQVDPTLLRPGDMPLLVGSTERLATLGLLPTAPDFNTLIPQILKEARTAAALC